MLVFSVWLSYVVCVGDAISCVMLLSRIVSLGKLNFCVYNSYFKCTYTSLQFVVKFKQRLDG